MVFIKLPFSATAYPSFVEVASFMPGHCVFISAIFRINLVLTHFFSKTFDISWFTVPRVYPPNSSLHCRKTRIEKTSKKSSDQYVFEYTLVDLVALLTVHCYPSTKTVDSGFEISE